MLPAPGSLVLASASPRRRALLSQLGLRFEVDSADIDESVHPEESPVAYVRRISLQKAEVVSRRSQGAWVLAADTTVVVDEDILGKPADDAEAKRMLLRLSGRTHRVLTGIALQGPRPATTVVTTEVTFRSLSEKEVTWYVASGEPSDKAGAYAIQGIGGFLVDRISGSPSNVVGLPLAETVRLLKDAGVELPFA